MNMDQLFKALPRDLQWEILSEFVGTHVVRKGKLIRKLVFDDRHKILLDISPIFPAIDVKYHIYYFYAISVVKMSNGRYLALGESPVDGSLSYGFRKILRYDEPWHLTLAMQLIPLDDTVLLHPFEKHFYPSYEYTDKKKKKKEPLLDALKNALNARI